MIDDLLFYFLKSDMIQTLGFGFILCTALIFTILYFWRVAP